MLHTAKYLKRRGIAVTMLTSRYDKTLAAYEEVEGVPVCRFMAAPIYRLVPIVFHLRCTLWLLLHPSVCNVIQFSNMPAYWLPVKMAARLLQKRVFLRMSMLGTDDLGTVSRSARDILRMMTYQRVDGILAMSRQLIEASKKHHRRPSIIHHVPKPVDLATFYPAANATEKASLRKKLGARIEEKIAIFVGSVVERKGIDLLVEAWPTVIKCLPKARLYIVGPLTFDREYSNANTDFAMRISKRIKELGIDSTVVFTGEKKEGVCDYLRMADLFVLPSRQEGIASAVLEAMASGLPCIVCKQPWLPVDLIAHGKTGLVCKPTAESLADGISSVLCNQQVAEQMGINARKVAEREYNPDGLTKRLIELYTTSLR